MRTFTDKCSTCVFHPGNRMRLAPGRLKQIIDGNRATSTALICHETLPYGEHPDLYPVVCRGFYDRFRDEVDAIAIIERMFGPYRQIPPPEDQQ